VAVTAASLSGACVNDATSAAAASSANPTLQVARDIHLLGTWAEDCTAPNPANWFVTFYSTPSGQVRRRSDTGSGEPPLDGTVDTAQRLGPNQVFLRLRNDDPNWGKTNGMAFDVTAQIGADYRSLDVIDSTGRTVVKNGIRTSDGKAMPVLHRC
jgi:hypothetical protein